MAKKEQKNLARELFLNTDLSQKEIADKVGVSQKTIHDWKEEGNWDKLKTAQRVTKTKTIDLLNQQLALLTEKTLQATKDGKYNPKDVDAQCKIASAIEKLQNKETLANYIQCFNAYANWLKEQNLEHAKIFADYSNKFLMLKAEELS